MINMLGKEQDKEDKILYINHSAEILLWLVVIAFFISLSSLGIIFKEKHDENDYQIFLPDVDGLIVGSPVRMMGIQVGHVVKIKPIKDVVYVKFILTNPEVYVPQGTQVTVEFSGMAGSKSLELYLPQKGDYIDKSTPIITVNPPKRLHDALSLLNDMFKKIGSIIYTTSDFGTKLQTEDLSTKGFSYSTSGMNDFIEYSNTFLDESNKKADHIRNSLKEFRKDAK
jgi:ABC-type transporter Mla subunit MlaD